jgi:two-component system response regulator HydG
MKGTLAMAGPRPETVWLIDDDGGYRRFYETALTRAGYSGVRVFEDGDRALEQVQKEKTRPDMVLLDLHFPDGQRDGLSVLREIRKAFSPTELPVIILTVSACEDDLVHAFRAGANDFVHKQQSIDVFLVRVEKEFANRRRHLQLEEYSMAAGAGEPALLGEAPAWQALLVKLAQLAPHAIPICLRGETGTGKEQLARYVHDHSARKGPFIKVNCAAITDSLFESELFGHVKRSFTGADRDRLGKFRAAEGGTLFLDEIGDLPVPRQASLLNVLQDRSVTPVGWDKPPIPVDVRIVTATNKDLEEEIRQGRFRGDLLHRLGADESNAVFLPPLRQRAGDVLVLARAFLKFFAERQQKRVDLAADAAAALTAYDWPGNARELRNTLERVIALKPSGGKLTAADFPLRPAATAAAVPGSQQPRDQSLPALDESYDRAQRSLIEQALSQSAYRVEGRSGAAARLGMKASTLRSRMKALGISIATATVAEAPPARAKGKRPRRVAAKKRATPSTREKSRKPRKVAARRAVSGRRSGT